MHVVIYMVDAEAMISGAAGAVSELKVRVFRICAAAYGTLVAIGLGVHIALCLFGGLFEVDGAL
jgi:hypothetical protein